MSNPYQPPRAPVFGRPEIGPPSVGKSIVEAFSSLTPGIVGILLASSLPQFAFDLYSEELQTSGRLGLFWLLLLATLPFSSFRAALCMSAARSVRSMPTRSEGAAMRESLEAWSRVFIADLIAGLIIAVGVLLLILPGLYLAIRYSFVDVVAFEQRLGAGASRQRSGELVDGRFWPVVALALVFFLPGMVMGFGSAALGEAAPIVRHPGVVALVSFGSSALSAIGSGACWIYYMDDPDYGTSNDADPT